MGCPSSSKTCFLAGAVRPGPSLVAALVVAASAGAGEGPPAAPPSPVQLRMQDSSVIVSDSFGGERAIRHAPGSHLVPKNQSLPRAEGLAFYGHSCYLMIIRADLTDASQVRVEKRVVYPGPIQSIATTEGGLPVTLTVQLGEGEADARRYRYPPLVDKPNPTVYPLDEAAFSAPMVDALKLVPGLGRDGSIMQDEREASKGRVRLLASAFDANPTNPWFKLYEGAIRRGDDPEAAREAFRAAVDAKGAPAFDYLRMSALLASMGEMAESDIAFERGFAEFVRSGLEPELVMSRAAFERIYALPLEGPPEAPGTAHAVAMARAREAGDTEAMMSLAERVRRLAPRCEGVTFAFAGIAEHLQERGRKSEAKVWLERAEASSRFAGPVGSRHVFYAGTSCLAALLVLLAICFIKTRTRQRKDLAPLGGWLASWRWTWERFTKMSFAYVTRKELIGIFIVACAGFVLSYTAIRAESSVFRASKLPEALKTGTWAHPGAVSYLDNLRSDPGRDANKLLYAIALQQETLNRGGGEEYDEVGGDPLLEAVAQNNKGVALWESTDPAGAGARFRKARDLYPGLVEARYNDEDKEEGGGQVGSDRTSRARRYLRGRKVMALPDAETLAGAFAGTEAQSEETERIGGLGFLKPLAWLTVILTAIVAALVLPFIVMRRKPPQKSRRGALAGLGYVFPGTSALLAPTGGILLAAWTYCLIVVVLIVRGDAAGGIDELSRIVERTFGVSGKIVFPFESAMMIFGPAAFVGLWVLNGVLLARASRFARAMARAAAHPRGSGRHKAVPVAEAGKAGAPERGKQPDKVELAEDAGQASGDKGPAAEEEETTPAEPEKEPPSPEEDIVTPDTLEEPETGEPAPAEAAKPEADEKLVEKPEERPAAKTSEQKPSGKKPEAKPAEKPSPDKAAKPTDARPKDARPTDAKPEDAKADEIAGSDEGKDAEDDDYQPPL